MINNLFGWDYPAGVTMLPGEEDVVCTNCGAVYMAIEFNDTECPVNDEHRVCPSCEYCQECMEYIDNIYGTCKMCGEDIEIGKEFCSEECEHKYYTEEDYQDIILDSGITFDEDGNIR